MTIEEITNEWKTDCKVDDNHLDQASSNTPLLHAKYIELLVAAKLKLAKSEKEHNKLRKQKFRYYRGEMTQQELKDLGWEQWQGAKPIKSDMDEFLKGDDDLNNSDLKLSYLETMIYLLESILTSIKSRDWNIKNNLEWKKFIVGS